MKLLFRTAVGIVLFWCNDQTTGRRTEEWWFNILQKQHLFPTNHPDRTTANVVSFSTGLVSVYLDLRRLSFWSWENLMLIAQTKNLTILSFPLCARVPYIYFNTQYKPEAFERFLSAIRNNGVFNFQSGYMNIFHACCVNGCAPSIMFIWYIYILNYTYFIVRNLDLESRLLPPGNISGCLETKATLTLQLLVAFT
jgi:hypothetical protein